ncbi:BREX-1 system adenine-specific DNA-methyltransferase PglX [Nesterenkonia sp. LB17]|uniref:N-6 DNA methylase n=1 Tax=Nesterenkonia sp. LB17 TaxID=2901230 RepID=UPI001F4D229F|nr:N-6 DNA methylase [Nesterenkonia sp. LB17]MCH8564626.1 BREX-1 system adenine-specific DNA-methyltransferase PglX [Nesterenkonia sp. LB17]
MIEAKITVLNSDQRRFLDAQTQRARERAQRAAEDALRALAAGEPSRLAYLTEEQNRLRLALRDKGRQLGDDTSRAGAPLANLVHDVAYEQWHCLLFARFLEVNELLRHPEYRDIPLSLDDCGDFAPDLGEPDAWAVAARFASEILPGVFRLSDPAMQVRFAAEHRTALERLLMEIPAEVFTTEDALGWVYQFWQTAEKMRVNDSGVKIGVSDLSPVTQLFTENYMVRFLLENSLGAWWAARHPDSPLIDGWEHMRRLDDGTPAAGKFSEWPTTAAEVSVMDPCCGSGHFLVAMFGMLWRMRAEEEGLSIPDAQDAVLRENLHGLELDPRCTQIAAFNLALEAWKQGGFRDLPAPQIACSGVPVRGTREEWLAHANGDSDLSKLLGRLHSLFRNADTLGSLISPRPADVDDAAFCSDMSIGAAWGEVRATLRKILEREKQEGTVAGRAATDVVLAAGLLARQYTLVATNVPYLSRARQDAPLRAHADTFYPEAKHDLAMMMLERSFTMSTSVAAVLPQGWTQLSRYKTLREKLLSGRSLYAYAFLGTGAFTAISGEVVNVGLLVAGSMRPVPDSTWASFDVADRKSPALKAHELKRVPPIIHAQTETMRNPDSRIVPEILESGPYLSLYADSLYGLRTGDAARLIRKFWEVESLGGKWRFHQSTTARTTPFAGREHILRWDNGDGALARLAGEGIASIQGEAAWGHAGVVVSLMGDLPVTRYTGESFDNNCAVVWPKDARMLPALWACLSDGGFSASVRRIDGSLKVTNQTLLKVPFDSERWESVAEEAPLVEKRSSDPRQWLFAGSPVRSAYPLQVAVARLLGYRWPDQTPDDLDSVADADGIAALESLPGEPDLSTRLRELLSVAYGGEWSSALERTLVTEAGGKNGRLQDWLRDTFFAQHVRVFGNRPFLWHVWDGRKDGFSAVINYHKLDHKTLEKLTFTVLGAWIERQKHETAAGHAGADARLAAAETLQARFKLILDGAPPYDIYVRWKELHEQHIGWNPDLDDGVRLNIRPFVTAGVLRSKVNIHWRKDRGTNSDGSERQNDLHPTLDQRRAARNAGGAAS